MIILGSFEFYNKKKERAKVTYNGFYYRIANNLFSTWEEALTADVKRNDSTDEYTKYQKIAKSNGINRSVFYNRVHKYNWTLKKAAYTPVRSRRIPKKYLYLAQKNNISNRLFRTRVVTLGWSLEKAATTPNRLNRESFGGYNLEELNEVNQEQKVINQIKFYQEKGLPVPKKYIKYAKENNLIIT